MEKAKTCVHFSIFMYFISESYMRFFRTQPFWPQIKPYFQVSQIVSTWVTELMSRLELQPDMSLNIGDLFPNATMLNEVIRAQLSLDEQTAVKLITGVTLNVNKVRISCK